MIPNPPDIWIVPPQGDTRPIIELVVTEPNGNRKYEKLELKQNKYYLAKEFPLHQINN